jgi:predicted choloylglycine hydrolase
MPLLHDSANEKKFDVRMVERNVLRGQVSQEEAEKFLKTLPDDSANAVTVNEADLDKQEVLSRRA